MASFVTVNEFKTFAGISLSDTTDNALITSLITQASGHIERVTDRKFDAADYREHYDGEGQARLYLKQNPIIYVTGVRYGEADALDVQYTGSRIKATVQVYPDGVRLHSKAADGTTSNDNLAFTDYPTLSTMATAIAAVSNWTASVSGDDYDSADLHPMGGQDAKSRTVTLTRPDEDEDDYRVDYDAGAIQFDGVRIGSGFRNYVVEYRGGYETIPDALKLLTLELVNSLYNESRRDPTLASESIGDYSYSVNTAATPDWTSRVMTAYGRVR